jgi:hypothetical protein
MAGLLDRALHARERALSPEDSGGVTGEDRERILADIEALFRAKRAPQARPSIRRKKGILLPLLVNSAGLLFIIVLFILSGSRGSRGYGAVGRRESIGLATEASLIERVRSEEGAKVSERDRRIAEIRAELERLRLSREPGAAAGKAPGPAEPLADADRKAKESGLKAELASLEGQPARRLSELERSRAEASFLLGELRGVYGEARRLAASGVPAAAREKTEIADRLLSRVEASGSANPDLDSLLREGNEALSAALLAAEPDPAQAAREAALAAARAGEEKALAAASGLKAQVADARRELEAARQALAERDARAAERLARSERLAAAFESTIAADRSRLARAEAPDEKKLLALLEAKLRLRETAGAEARARGDPGLYEDFERSLDELARAEREAGALEALRGVSSAIGELESAVAPGSGSPREAAEDYLQSLDGLLSSLIEGLR